MIRPFRKSPLLILLVIAVIALDGCRRDERTFELNPPPPVEQLNKMLTSLRGDLNPATTIAYSFNNKIPDSLTTDDGVRVYVEQGSICNAANTIVCGGIGTAYCEKLRIQVTEISKNGELIINGLTTSTQAGLLEAAGLVQVALFCDDTPLYLAANQHIRLRLPNAALYNGLSVYYSDPIAKNARNNWIPDELNNDVARVLWQNNGNTYSGYEFLSRRLDWVLCAHQPAGVTNVSVAAQMPNGLDDSNTRVYAIMNNALAVIELQYDATRGVFVANGLPEGAKMKLIALGARSNGSFFSSTAEITVKAGLQQFLSPETATKETIREFLLNL